eukprot:80507-Prymnesium_polylepis.1
MSSHITRVVPSSDGYVRPTAKTTRPHVARQARSRGTVRGVAALPGCTQQRARRTVRVEQLVGEAWRRRP